MNATARTGKRAGTTPLDPKNPEDVRDVAVTIYKNRLDAGSGGGKGAVERMIVKDGDAGEKLRARAVAYDSIARAVMTEFVVRKRGLS